MATVLHGNQTLRSVDLSRPLLHSRLEESTIHISRMLQVNSTLTELKLSLHSMTDTGCEWLCRHLRENTSLTHLDVSRSAIYTLWHALLQEKKRTRETGSIRVNLNV
jgi:hypothetical protein